MRSRILLLLVVLSLPTTTSASSTDDWEFVGKTGLSLATGFLGVEARKSDFSYNFGFWGLALSFGGKYYFQAYDMPLVITAVVGDGTLVFDSFQMLSLERQFMLSEDVELTAGLGYIELKEDDDCPCETESETRLSWSLVYRF